MNWVHYYLISCFVICIATLPIAILYTLNEEIKIARNPEQYRPGRFPYVWHWWVACCCPIINIMFVLMCIVLAFKPYNPYNEPF